MDDREISIDELRDLLDHGQPVTVIDVRRAADRKEWAIPDSIHVDVHDALWAKDPNALTDFVPPPNQPIVTVCGRGQTSLLAAERLRARGIAARSLHGGMHEWSLAWNVAPVPLAGIDAQVLQVRRTGKGCLSYVIGSRGSAMVIDPSVDPVVYVRLAKEHAWTITAVMDTHVHADHLSRARQLADMVGATVYLPDQRRVRYPFTPLRDGQTLPVGDATLEVLATPGHTLESTCYLLGGEALFTGDTLFPSSVGRPDLASAATEETRERARRLYASLQRLKALPGATVVLAGHTSEPIAFDQKAISATLVEAWGRSELLRLHEPDFVEAILARIPPPPANHLKIVELNEQGTMPADTADLEAGANRCAVG